MRYTLNHFEMANFIYCEKCEATPGETCTTRTGRRATWPHSARTNAVSFIWTEGFIDGQLDALYSPESARRWLTKDGYLAETA